jgi:hypothetical protein
MKRLTVPGVSGPIGEGPTHSASTSLAPQAEKSLPGCGEGWLPFGNVVCVSVGTASVLGGSGLGGGPVPQACEPPVFETP